MNQMKKLIIRNFKDYKKNNLTGQIHKISCYEFWKGKNSYRILQDKFYNYVKENGFEYDESNFKCKEFVEN